MFLMLEDLFLGRELCVGWGWSPIRSQSALLLNRLPEIKECPLVACWYWRHLKDLQAPLGAPLKELWNV